VFVFCFLNAAFLPDLIIAVLMIFITIYITIKSNFKKHLLTYLLEN
jgi:hypothetical protein